MFYQPIERPEDEGDASSSGKGSKLQRLKDALFRATPAQLRNYVDENRRFAGSEYQPASAKNWWLP